MLFLTLFHFRFDFYAYFQTTTHQLKRFTDLTIDLSGLPAQPKLVLLIGSNGSGKSSVFDAFNIFINGASELSYYLKNNEKDFQVQILTKGEGKGMNGTYSFGKKSSTNARMDRLPYLWLYGRTSLRQIPRLTRKRLGEDSASVEHDEDRPLQYIDRDERFENDLEHIIKLILKEFFTSDKRRGEIIDKYIGPLNDAFRNIFGENPKTSLSIQSLIPPLEGEVAEILFQKGESQVPYNLLSSGEKEVFNILINLLSRRHLYQDTVYFIDELDLHLNTALQYNLLKEITENWIPENCQLWTASHSLGFIDYANDTDHSAIIDFDDLDFDVPQVLFPEPKNKVDVYEIAVPKTVLPKLFANRKIVFCENQNDEYYNLLNLPDTVFVGITDNRAVFLTMKSNEAYHGIRDRDYLSNDEIKKIRQKFPRHHILPYYTFENFLYHPDNIAELKPKDFNRQKYIEEITRQKNEKLLNIVAGIAKARDGYEEMKIDTLNDNKKKAEELNTILEALRSNEFEVFYPFFNMKGYFTKTVIERFNLSAKELVQTQWFKAQISKVLGF